MSLPSQPDDGRAEAAAGGSAKAKRPRWLLVSLLFALLLGVSGWSEGCTRLELYRAGPELSAELHAGIQDSAARATAESAYASLIDTLHASKRRTAPLAAATFVLGAALLALASRGLARHKGARPVLVQVVSVQAVLTVVTWFALHDVRIAEHVWEDARRNAAALDQALPLEWRERLDHLSRMKLRFGSPGWLAVRTLGSALVVLALTRPRTKHFFEGTERSVPE